MKLTTILLLPAATPAEKVRRIGELVVQKIAARLPQRLRYEVLISCGAQAMGYDEEVPAVAFTDVLKRTPRGSK